MFQAEINHSLRFFRKAKLEFDCTNNSAFEIKPHRGRYSLFFDGIELFETKYGSKFIYRGKHIVSEGAGHFRGQLTIKFSKERTFTIKPYYYKLLSVRQKWLVLLGSEEVAVINVEGENWFWTKARFCLTSDSNKVSDEKLAFLLMSFYYHWKESGGE